MDIRKIPDQAIMLVGDFLIGWGLAQVSDTWCGVVLFNKIQKNFHREVKVFLLVLNYLL